LIKRADPNSVQTFLRLTLWPVESRPHLPNRKTVPPRGGGLVEKQELALRELLEVINEKAREQS
jgi:hypothetical protein